MSPEHVVLEKLFLGKLILGKLFLAQSFLETFWNKKPLLEKAFPVKSVPGKKS